MDPNDDGDNHHESDGEDSADASIGGSSDDDSSAGPDWPQQLDLLARDDPDLTTLSMASFYGLANGTRRPLGWHALGRIVCRNTRLELVTFHRIREAVTMETYGALFDGLVRNRSITDVDILQTDLLGGAVLTLLSPMIERICQLTIEDCSLGHEGGMLLAQALQMPVENAGGDGEGRSALEEVNFDRIGAGEPAMIHVIRALRKHSRVLKLSLRDDDIGAGGCRELAHLLPIRHNGSGLITLDLGQNGIEDEGARILASGLNGVNSAITHLNLDMSLIHERGQLALFNLLRGPTSSSNSRLKSLSLNETCVSEAGFFALANAMENNSTLTDLYLDNTGITHRGLLALSAALRGSRSGLKHLSLCKNRIKNRGAIGLANALGKNDSLTRLNLEHDTTITMKGWKAFSRLLCCKTSIMDTYLSNHTLQKLVSDEWTLPGDLMSLLLLNREGESQNVARRKIVMCHFSGRRLDIQPLVDMEPGVMPRVVYWMGQDGPSLLYQFLKVTQSLFNIGRNVEDGPTIKRRRGAPKIHRHQPALHCPMVYHGEWWHKDKSSDCFSASHQGEWSGEWWHD